jgi:AcrR family transcriptional regulator
MAKPPGKGRTNQRLRTRKELLLAAASIIKEGRIPGMDAVADKALVSRATAYRYFPSLESLLVEAPLEGRAPVPEELFADDRTSSPEDRLDKAEAALHEMSYSNEAQLRVMLAHSLSQENVGGQAPLRRQNRRTELIDAALAPCRARFDGATYQKLCRALALVFGTESMIVFRDVVPISKQAARELKSWMIRALVRAALHESKKRG